LNSNNIVAPDDTKMIFNDTKTLLLNNNNLMKDTNEKSYIQVPSSTSSSIDTKKLMYSGSTKLYLRSLKTLLNQIEQIQKAISMRSSSVNSKLFVMSVLKQLKNLNMKQQQQHMPQTFSSLFSPPSIHCKSSNKLEPKTMSFSKILSSSEQTPTHFYTKPAVRMWTPQKRKQLIKAVQYELNEMMKKQEHQSKVNQISKKELVQESESVHYVNDIKICDIEKSLDWIHISQYHLDNQWSSIACKNAWEQICNDRINQEQWCEQEEQLLIDLVKHEQIIDDHSMGDKWSMIAQMLNTGRSAYLCAKRYMQIVNEKYSKRFLDDNERSLLIDCVQRVREGHYIPWNSVSYTLETRTREFIYSQWFYIDPNCKRGRWTSAEEKELLCAAYGDNGVNNSKTITNWPLLTSTMRTRTSRQCRERYLTLQTLNNNGHLVQTSNINKQAFTFDEDMLIMKKYSIYGPKWAKIARDIKNRTDNSILVRHRMLMKAKEKWSWYNKSNRIIKQFIKFFYDKNYLQSKNIKQNKRNFYMGRPPTLISSESTVENDDLDNWLAYNDVVEDIVNFGFYRKGLPFNITDDEIRWFKKNPTLTVKIANIAINEFRDKKYCHRKLKALMKPWFENEDQINIPSDCDIRTMLNQTLSYGRKRKLIITTEHSQNKIQKLVPSSTLIFETDTANVNLTQNIKDDIDEQEQLSDSRARNVLKHVKINFANQLIDQLLNPQSSSTKHFKNIFHQTSFESCGL
ncbi:unnamed protein product, partial [Didymodactylos carnosus]